MYLLYICICTSLSLSIYIYIYMYTAREREREREREMCITTRVGGRPNPIEKTQALRLSQHVTT